MSDPLQRPCPGCLGSLWCWVCEGYGRLPLPDGTPEGVSCPRCSGTGACSVCCRGFIAAKVSGHPSALLKEAPLPRPAATDQPPAPAPRPAAPDLT